jgi:hypothetical protein
VDLFGNINKNKMGIISLSGKLNSGKDTLAKILMEQDKRYVVKKWAGKLKQVATMLTGVPVEMWEDQEFKKQKMTSEWGGMTYREFLQKLGTDGLRDGLHKNVWVNALMSEYRTPNEFVSVPESMWVITDTRFPNEANAVRKAGGVVAVVRRPCQVCEQVLWHDSWCKEGNKPENNHASETSLDSYSFDYVVPNYGTLEDFKIETFKFINYVRSKTNQESRI